MKSPSSTTCQSPTRSRFLVAYDVMPHSSLGTNYGMQSVMTNDVTLWYISHSRSQPVAMLRFWALMQEQKRFSTTDAKIHFKTYIFGHHTIPLKTRNFEVTKVSRMTIYHLWFYFSKSKAVQHTHTSPPPPTLRVVAILKKKSAHTHSKLFRQYPTPFTELARNCL